MKKLKLFIIAGEASGNLLAEKIINELRQQSNIPLEIKGVVGDQLIKEGITSIFPQSDIAVMGFFEVVPAIARVLNRINLTIAEIIKFQPDIIITIDAPDFNFRVVKKLKKTKRINAKFIHFVAPTVWAYRPKRAQKIAPLYDLLLVLLPFEPPYFEKFGLETLFIGHPIMYHDYKLDYDLRQKYNIPKNNRIISLTLGSRNKEIEMLQPIYKKALKQIIKQQKNLTIVIPTFARYQGFLEKWSADLDCQKIITIISQEKLEFFKISDCVIAKSGTNIIEIAKQGAPFFICYKVNLLTYILLKMMVKTKYVNLLNIFAKCEIIPELIQYKCNADNIAYHASKILNNPEHRAQQIAQQNKYVKGFYNKQNIAPEKIAAQRILNLVS